MIKSRRMKGQAMQYARGGEKFVLVFGGKARRKETIRKV
jgi:hypothetical protein